MTFFEKLKTFSKIGDTSKNSRVEERLAADKRLSVYFAEENELRKIREKGQYEELQAREQKNEEDRIAADNRLKEYLDEERLRKKVLEQKLYDELQTKNRELTEYKHKRQNDSTALKKNQEDQQNDEQKQIQEEIIEQKIIEESKPVRRKIKISNPHIDTQFLYQDEANMTNLGDRRIRIDKFSDKIGYTRKK
jgi:hypothetical protein